MQCVASTPKSCAVYVVVYVTVCIVVLHYNTVRLQCNAVCCERCGVSSRACFHRRDEDDSFYFMCYGASSRACSDRSDEDDFFYSVSLQNGLAISIDDTQQIELPAKLIGYFLWSNKSNINQISGCRQQTCLLFMLSLGTPTTTHFAISFSLLLCHNSRIEGNTAANIFKRQSLRGGGAGG